MNNVIRIMMDTSDGLFFMVNPGISIILRLFCHLDGLKLEFCAGRVEFSLNL